MKDVNGIALAEGQKVVVARRQGSSMWLVSTRVLRVEDDGRPVLEGASRSYKYQGSPRAIMVYVGAPVLIKREGAD